MLYTQVESQVEYTKVCPKNELKLKIKIFLQIPLKWPRYFSPDGGGGQHGTKKNNSKKK